MTGQARNTGHVSDGTRSTHLVIATHTREIKTALFLALTAIPTITIVATASSTAELISYCHAFQPDTTIVENGLPGRPLTSVLYELGTAIPEMRTLLIDEHADVQDNFELINVEIVTDPDQLISTIHQRGAEAP